MSGHILEHLGYHVIARTSSIEALALFKSKPDQFDLVITDMTMSNMTGDKLAVELMSIRPGIPVILCTGYSKEMSDASVSKIGIKALIWLTLVKRKKHPLPTVFQRSLSWLNFKAPKEAEPV